MTATIPKKDTPARDDSSMGYTMTLDQVRAAWMRKVIGIDNPLDPPVHAISVPAYIVVNHIGLIERGEDE